MKGIVRRREGELYFCTCHSHDEVLMSVIEESGLFNISNNVMGEVVLETIHLSVSEFSAAAYLVYRCTYGQGSDVGQTEMSEERKKAVFRYLMDLCRTHESNKLLFKLRQFIFYFFLIENSLKRSVLIFD